MPKVSVIGKACENRLLEEFRTLKEYRASGSKAAGYTCHAFPASVAAGMGFWPVRALCGTTPRAERAGEKLVRPDVCPHVKSLLGNISESKGLHGEIDIWVGLYTCDQMRRALNIIAEKLDKEVHPIQFPATRTKEAAEYYALQVKRFISDAGALHNEKFDAERAIKWGAEHNAAAQILTKAVLSFEISPLDLHAMFHLLFVSRPDGLAELFKKVIAESDKFRGDKRIVLTGSPLTSEDTSALEVLEEKGISVIPLNCTGLNSIEGNGFQTDGDLISSLAISAFNMPSCMRARPNASVYKRIEDVLKSTKADGLIVKCLKFCDCWYTERERIRKTFNRPVLVFDSDYSEGGRERLVSRIDAFLETL